MKCRIDIKGKKIWRDGNNIAETRPASVEITLLRNGEVYETVTVDSEGDGSYLFSCLPVWKNSDEKYIYTVDELVVPEGYTKTVSGYNIINTVEPGSITIVGTKTWVDHDNIDVVRPAEITVNLLQNGIQYLSEIVASPADEEDTAEFSFVDVPQFDSEGVPFVYTGDEEIEVTHYTKTIDGFNITNALSKSAAPIIHPVATIDTEISGTGVAGCELTVTLPTLETVTVTVEADGTWSIPATGLLKDDVISASQRCQYKLVSDSVEAIVTESIFSVDYLPNGGNGEFSDLNLAYSLDYRVKTVEEAGIVHPGTGWWFSGWNTEVDGSGDSYAENQVITLTEDLVLYAQWYRNYSVSYSRNTASPYVNVKTGRDDQIYTIENPEDVNCENPGYDFVKWNTSANGKGTTYNPGDEIMLTGNLYLYAQWEETP